MEDFEKRVLREYYPEGSAEYAAAAALVDGGEPLAYVVGEQYFYGERYKLNRDCLIPRPDTECVVDELLRRLPKGARFADLCCGSGCIAISALCHSEGTSALGADISPGALAAAEENAASNGVAGRYTTRLADLLAPGFELGERFAAVVSNPPYIRSGELALLEESVRREPALALDGGEDGLIFYRALIGGFERLVEPEGVMVLEIGYDQGEALRTLAAAAGLECAVRRDYGGRERVCTLSRSRR